VQTHHSYPRCNIKGSVLTLTRYVILAEISDGFTQCDYYRREKTLGFNVSFGGKFWFSRYLEFECRSVFVATFVGKASAFVMKRWGIQQERIRLSSEKRCEYSCIARWYYFSWTHPRLGNWMFWKFHISQSNYEIPQPGKPHNFRF